MPAVTTWRSETPIDLLLVRHAEAHKNREDRHGGGNPRLTPLGRSHCEAIRSQILRPQSDCNCSTLVLAQPVTQVLETIEHLRLDGTYAVREVPDLQGISLGNLAGLSRSEAAARHPLAAALLEEWRSGSLKLTGLVLPGGEPAETFHARVTSAFADALSTVTGAVSRIIVISTRSTLILIHNALLMDSAFTFDSYEPWEFSNGSLTSWRLSADAPPSLQYFNAVPGVAGMGRDA